MPFGDLRALVRAYINRTDAILERDGVDLVLAAANQAKAWAERTHSFEYLRATIALNVAGDSGGLLAATVNRVERVFTSAGVRLRFCDKGTVALSRDRYVPAADYASEAARLADPTSNQPYSAYQQGQRIYVAPAIPPLFVTPTSTVVLAVDVVNLSTAYVLDTDDDFFLTRCQDWLMFRTLLELNNFLKADDRMQVATALVADAWQQVVAWDESLVPREAINTISSPVSQ